MVTETKRTCERCGNDYDKTFQILMNGSMHVFDSFECAIETLAPRCAHCALHIIGHGLEMNDVFFCCNNCAKSHGVESLKDRAS